MNMLLIAVVSQVTGTAEVSGGMSLVSPEIVKDLFYGLACLVSSLAVLVWGTRRMRKEVREVEERIRLANDQINVNKIDKPVSRGECQQYRCALQKQIDEIGPAINRMFLKLDENDKRSEERAKDTHRRLDPILKSVAGNMARVDVLEKIVTAKGQGVKK